MTIPTHGVSAADPAAASPTAAPDTSLDRYARLVRRVLGVPTSLVSLVETERQVFPGAAGLPEPFQTTRETPISHSFCRHVVAGRRPLIVADARGDERLRENPAIHDLHVVAYAGWPLTDASGTVIGSLCAVDDQPHRWTRTQLEDLADLAAACSAELAGRELTRRLTMTVAELERSNEHLAAFSAQVSHDLRTPLAVLSASLEVIDDLRLLDVPDLAAMGPLIDRAHQSTERMTRLVDDVLSFAVVGGRLCPVDVDVAQLVADVLDDLSAEVAGSLVDVGDLPPVRADPVLLRVLLQNLVSNAAKHAAGSVLRVDARTDAGSWHLAVVDHGPGIDPGDRSRVLEPFVRLGSDVPGSGMGLATCRRIAQAHDGALVLTETPGGGTTARLRLPQPKVATSMTNR